VNINGRDGSIIGSGGNGGAVAITAGNAGGDASVARNGGGIAIIAGTQVGGGANGEIQFTTGGSLRAKIQGAGHLILSELAANPSAANLTSGSNAKDRLGLYMANDKIIFAYNNGGTVTYISIPLDGSTTTWTHSTTAP
jgi:hypothetical protein